LRIKLIFFLLVICSIAGGQQRRRAEVFDHFIVQFFALEEFQRERTILPREHSRYHSGQDTILTEIITEKSWQVLKDEALVNSHYFRRIYENFELRREPTGQRVYAYQGNENGKDIRYYFELQNGKWFLLRSENLSN